MVEIMRKSLRGHSREVSMNRMGFGRCHRVTLRRTLPVAVTSLLAVVAITAVENRTVHAGTPNTVVQWNVIAEEAVIRSRAFQSEGFLYMAYVSAAVYDAVVAIEGGYVPYGDGVATVPGASTDAAVIEAAYRTLVHYFPGQRSIIEPQYTAALNGVVDGIAKTQGQLVGESAANLVIGKRANDGRMTPVGTSSEVSKTTPGPGVWRLTPPTFAAPQTPWLAHVAPFLLQSPDQFLPDPPPSLSSLEWTDAFEQLKKYGSASSKARSPEQTTTALFWTANVVRQYNRAIRDVADEKGLSLLESARLQAMVNMIGADALIAGLNAKYTFLFWRPVTAIDPTAVVADGFGPVPGVEDGNSLTHEEVGWRPLVATPNHPEYPAAHGTITSAMVEVFSTFLGVSPFAFKVRGFDPAGATGNLDAVRTFSRPNDLRYEIIEARLFAGLHYHFSSVAGVVLGRKVARYDLRSAFQPVQ
jgi:hypothetical protein